MIPINPGEKEFVAFAKNGESPITPLIFKLPNDGLLAWSAFAKLQQNESFAFLLESAETGKNGRYSFMGASPSRLLVYEGGVFRVQNGAGETTQETVGDDPMSALEKTMRDFATTARAAPLPFIGGVVGYMGYDCAHYFEPLGDMKKDELNIPDMLWMQTDALVVFDHFSHDLFLCKSCRREEASGGWEKVYRQTRRQFDVLLKKLRAPTPISLTIKTAKKPPPPVVAQSNIGRDGYCRAVAVAKRHILAGDIFQVVPSQRFSFSQPAAALDIYRCLRRINPSPYMFYLKCKDFVVAGSSPELMVGCERKKVRIRPIAGTRPRGRDEAEDAKMESELRADEKEIAEHLMLVDLGRNDVGRVAATGTVEVPAARFCRVEKYSHVMHMVSDVCGELANGKTAFDALRATFPAGTLSGAPKVRAMQIINQLEPCKRNAYGGLAGYIGFDGDALTCIAIRAFVVKDGLCHVQSGGGVVDDSAPEKEYEESVNKAMAVLRAAQTAGEESAAKELAEKKESAKKKESAEKKNDFTD